MKTTVSGHTTFMYWSAVQGQGFPKETLRVGRQAGLAAC